jgi:hypothetical protein
MRKFPAERETIPSGYLATITDDMQTALIMKANLEELQP